MKNKFVFSLISGFLLLFLLSGCAKDTYNNDFENDVILNNLTIDKVKVAELNTINDILNRFKGSQILNVVVCYEGEQEYGCPSYSYDKFLSNEVSKFDISNVSFNILVPTNQKNLIITFSTYYGVFKEKQNDSQYYSLEMDTLGTVKLDKVYIELLPLDVIKNKYNIASRSNEYMYYIDFESKTGDKYYFIGHENSPYIQIFNISERDRNIKK